MSLNEGMPHRVISHKLSNKTLSPGDSYLYVAQQGGPIGTQNNTAESIVLGPHWGLMLTHYCSRHHSLWSQGVGTCWNCSWRYCEGPWGRKFTCTLTQLWAIWATTTLPLEGCTHCCNTSINVMGWSGAFSLDSAPALQGEMTPGTINLTELWWLAKPLALGNALLRRCVVPHLLNTHICIHRSVLPSVLIR